MQGWKTWGSCVLGGLLSFTPTWADKPGDLPQDGKVELLDLKNYGNVEGFRDSEQRQAPRGNEAEPVFQPVNQVGETTESAQVKVLFDKAERNRVQGRAAEARTRYQQVHLMSPTSRLGRLAIDRIHSLENSSSRGEESEPPFMERRSAPRLPNMLPVQPQKTKPLGMAELPSF